MPLAVLLLCLGALHHDGGGDPGPPRRQAAGAGRRRRRRVLRTDLLHVPPRRPQPQMRDDPLPESNAVRCARMLYFMSGTRRRAPPLSVVACVEIKSSRRVRPPREPARPGSSPGNAGRREQLDAPRHSAIFVEHRGAQLGLVRPLLAPGRRRGGRQVPAGAPGRPPVAQRRPAILEDLTDNLHHDVQDGSPFAGRRGHHDGADVAAEPPSCSCVFAEKHARAACPSRPVGAGVLNKLPARFRLRQARLGLGVEAEGWRRRSSRRSPPRRRRAWPGRPSWRASRRAPGRARARSQREDDHASTARRPRQREEAKVEEDERRRRQ